MILTLCLKLSGSSRPVHHPYMAVLCAASQPTALQVAASHLGNELLMAAKRIVDPPHLHLMHCISFQLLELLMQQP